MNVIVGTCLLAFAVAVLAIEIENHRIAMQDRGTRARTAKRENDRIRKEKQLEEKRKWDWILQETKLEEAPRSRAKVKTDGKKN